MSLLRNLAVERYQSPHRHPGRSECGVLVTSVMGFAGSARVFPTFFFDTPRRPKLVTRRCSTGDGKRCQNAWSVSFHAANGNRTAALVKRQENAGIPSGARAGRKCPFGWDLQAPAGGGSSGRVAVGKAPGAQANQRRRDRPVRATERRCEYRRKAARWQRRSARNIIPAAALIMAAGLGTALCWPSSDAVLEHDACSPSSWEASWQSLLRRGSCRSRQRCPSQSPSVDPLCHGCRSGCNAVDNQSSPSRRRLLPGVRLRPDGQRQRHLLRVPYTGRA